MLERWRENRRLARAQREHERDLARRLRALHTLGSERGEDDPAAFTAAVDLASYLTAECRDEEARDAWQKIAVVSRLTHGPDHIETLHAQGELAYALWVLEDNAGARSVQALVLPALRRTHGEDHPLTLSAAMQLASIMRDLGERREARALLQDAVERGERTLGRGHEQCYMLRTVLASMDGEPGREQM